MRTGDKGRKEKKEVAPACSQVHSQLFLSSSSQLDSLASLVKVNKPNAASPSGQKDMLI